MRDRRLSKDLLRRLAPRLAGAGGEDGPQDDGLAHRAVLEQPLLQRGADHGLHRRAGLGVVELVLGLPLKLRVLDVDREQTDHALADVVGVERHALGLDLLGLDEGADRLDDGAVEAVFVGAARVGGDAVDVGADVLLGGLRPLERGLQADAVLLRHVEDDGVRRRVAALGDELGEVVGDAVGVEELHLLAGGFIAEKNGQPTMKVSLRLQALADYLGVEAPTLSEDLRIGAKNVPVCHVCASHSPS